MLPLLSYSPGDGLTDGEADGLNDREAIDRSDPASPPAPHATIDVREKNKAQATIDCGGALDDHGFTPFVGGA